VFYWALTVLAFDPSQINTGLRPQAVVEEGGEDAMVVDAVGPVGDGGPAFAI
jgi:hypothetical protein